LTDLTLNPSPDKGAGTSVVFGPNTMASLVETRAIVFVFARNKTLYIDMRSRILDYAATGLAGAAAAGYVAFVYYLTQ
jgi:hypothetical protein